MPKSCIICRAVASPDLQIQYCSVCQSASYCSRKCQKKDWNKKQHKQICKLLNVGHGVMQVRAPIHTRRSIGSKEEFEEEQRSLNEDTKRFFKLFEESTFEGSRAAARKMRKIAKRESKRNQKFLLFHSLRFLIRTSNSEMLSWPNSPLVVLLHFVDPNVLSGREDVPLPEGYTRVTLLHQLAEIADHSDYSTHENQLILARQLIEHDANVNAVSSPQGRTPLHDACNGGNVTNLDFVEYLLEAGADPNSQDQQGLTPLMCTTPSAPGAAKFLLNWPAVDANITTRSGASFLARVRNAVRLYSEQAARPDNPDQIQHQFLLRQWREIEEMLVERGAHDTGITALY
jgi:ankyrin repeat protein